VAGTKDDVELAILTSNVKTSGEPDIEKAMDPKRIGGRMHLTVSGPSKNATKD
jgi:hypothetical protein